MKKVVISASASLQLAIQEWADYWQKKNCRILNWPRPIAKKDFLKKWPDIHQDFYKSLDKADILFVANENAKGQRGYIGNAVFAEIAFCAGLNLTRKKKIEIILRQRPDKKNKFFEDLECWRKLGWLKILIFSNSL